MRNYYKDVETEIPQIPKQLIFKEHFLNLCIVASSVQANPDIVLPSYCQPHLALMKVYTIILILGNPLYSANPAKDFGDTNVPISIKKCLI